MVVIQTGSDNSSYVCTYAVLGCADIETPPNSWIQRDDSMMIIHCNTADQQTYSAKCVQHSWVGDIGSCLHDAASTTTAYHGTVASFKHFIVLCNTNCDESLQTLFIFSCLKSISVKICALDIARHMC